MTEPRTIMLGGHEIAVPALPLRLNMRAYQLCRKLTNGGLLERVMAAAGQVDCDEEEMDAMAELAFIGGQAADPALDRDTFDSWTITPPELLDAFFNMRYQTGGWIAVTPKEGGADTGEAKGAKKPPK